MVHRDFRNIAWLLLSVLVLAGACGDTSASRDDGPEPRRPMPPPLSTDERCLPGEVAPCYGGPNPGVPIEECHLGERECTEDGFWGSCRGWRRADTLDCGAESSTTPSGHATETEGGGAGSTTEAAPTRVPTTEAPDPTEPDPTELDPTELDPTAPDPTELDPTAPDPTAPDPTAPDPTAPDPTGPVDPGTYVYSAIPVAGFGNSVTVDWSPDGTWAVIGRRSGAVHVVDGDSLAVSRVDLPGGGTQYIERVRFDPQGRAWVLGWRAGASETGFVHLLERDPDDGEVVWHTPEPPVDQSFQAIVWDTHDDLGLMLGATRSSPYQFRLWSVDPETLEFSIVHAAASGAGCQDLARVDNEFGDVGYLVVCGLNGSAAHYWTRVAGEFERRFGQALGTTNLGNISRADGHPGGAYALVIGWSGRRVHRFEAGQFVTQPSAPWFSTRGIFNVRFAEDGLRALITGRRTVSPPGGLVMEYRHDLWRCPSPSTDCDITEVLVPGFDAPPWNAGSNADLAEAAWRPGCDGGLIVGGESGFSIDMGILARFDIVGGRPCWPE